MDGVCAPFGRWAGKQTNILRNFHGAKLSTVPNCPRCQIVLGSRCSRGSCSINKTSNFLFQMTKSLVFLRLPQQLFRKGKITKSLAKKFLPRKKRAICLERGKWPNSLRKNSSIYCCSLSSVLKEQQEIVHGAKQLGHENIESQTAGT